MVRRARGFWTDFDDRMRKRIHITMLPVWAAVLMSGCGGSSGSQSSEPPVNRPPTISGSPSGTVGVGDAYVFLPSAADPDGDSLIFSIRNQPSWASFDPATGRISGSPSPGDEGEYTNIAVSVTDGTVSSTLDAFTITVLGDSSDTITLTWTPPTRNVDGSQLTNLAGYVVYVSIDNAPAEMIRIENPGVSTYVLANVTPGTYSIVISSYNSDGVESAYSNRVEQTIFPYRQINARRFVAACSRPSAANQFSSRNVFAMVTRRQRWLPGQKTPTNAMRYPKI